MGDPERIVILGIDALEYNLVEEWDLRYLKQKSIEPVIKTRKNSSTKSRG